MLNFFVSCANGTAGTRKIITSIRNGQSVNHAWTEKRCTIHTSPVNSDMIILPSRHIKLGLFKNFVKALDKNGAGFHYLKEIFPRVSDSKIKEGIFVVPK